jgi:amidohydrolase
LWSNTGSTNVTVRVTANMKPEDFECGEFVEWRRDLHAHPELLYDVQRTASFVATKLNEFGCDEIATEIGRTGVVGLIHGRRRTSGKVIGLRADMDALPIEEATGVPWASQSPGKMHACGHDGHTAMLLGAAQLLARTRQFDGAAAVVFQPAEEGGGGGKAMVDDGLMSRFGINEIYAMHAEPGLPVGQFATTAGPIGASADGFRIHIEGKGAHGASPHVSIDPLVTGANIVLALQSIVSRNVHPRKCAVVTVGALNGGKAGNVIPQSAELVGTARTFEPELRDLIETRVIAIAEKVAEAYGAKATVAYRRMYPPTVNHVRETLFAVRAARAVVGEPNVNAELEPLMGSEDFAFMLEERPGNIMLIGNGDTAGVHDPRYDFNDAAIPYGIAYFRSLIESGMPM